MMADAAIEAPPMYVNLAKATVVTKIDAKRNMVP
jgi:hypothetical protein